MLSEGTIAELIIKLEPKPYRKYTWKNEHNTPMLYVKLKRYGILQVALIFCKLLSNTLTLQHIDRMAVLK